jgi:hypothetical protein
MTSGAIAIALFALGVGVNLVFGRRGFMPLDHSIVFDGGWRLLSGQIPFRDFTAPSGIVPAAMQVPFFALFGVTWFALCLHASIVNGIFCAAVFALLRLCGSTRLEAALFGGLTAFFFYPPTGTPFMDQHSFFFMTLMWLAAVIGTVSTGRAEWAAWFTVPMLFTLGFLSGQIPVSFGALCVAAWVVVHRARAPRWIGALGAGALFVGLCALLAAAAWRVDLRSAFEHLVRAPLSVGGARTAHAGVIGPVRLIAATLVHMPGWLRLWSFDAALAAAILALATARNDGPARLRLWMLASSIFATAGFLAYTRTLFQTGVALAMATVALAVAALPTVRLRRLGAAVAALVALAAVRDTVWFVTTVDGPRIEHVRYDPGEADLATGHLPPGLEFMRWSRGASHYEPEEMTALVRYLHDADGNFFLIGDSSILYGLARKPSVSPVLWFDPGLTTPPPGSAQFSQFEAELLDRITRDNVHRIVVEGPLTWMKLTAHDFPRVTALTKDGGCGERLFGAVRVLEVCAPAVVRN